MKLNHSYSLQFSSADKTFPQDSQAENIAVENDVELLQSNSTISDDLFPGNNRYSQRDTAFHEKTDMKDIMKTFRKDININNDISGHNDNIEQQEKNMRKNMKRINLSNKIKGNIVSTNQEVSEINYNNFKPSNRKMNLKNNIDGDDVNTVMNIHGAGINMGDDSSEEYDSIETLLQQNKIKNAKLKEMEEDEEEKENVQISIESLDLLKEKLVELIILIENLVDHNKKDGRRLYVKAGSKGIKVKYNRGKRSINSIEETADVEQETIDKIKSKLEEIKRMSYEIENKKIEDQKWSGRRNLKVQDEKQKSQRFLDIMDFESS